MLISVCGCTGGAPFLLALIQHILSCDASENNFFLRISMPYAAVYFQRFYFFLGGGGAKRVPLQIALFVRPSDPLRVISKDH